MNDSQPTSVPHGYCHCGCGGKTIVSPKNSRHHGYVRGEPRRYIKGHNARKPLPPPETRLCGCGCGNPTTISKRTNSMFGHERGRPVRYLPGHNTAKTPVSDVDYIPDPATGCWIWQRGISGGYGVTGKEPAHRMVYVRLRGPVPNGLHLDHLCRNPSCVNPDHLEPVTPAENTRRGRGAKLGHHGAFLARVLHATTTLSYRDIAEVLGVADMTARDAVVGVSWR